MRSQNKTGPGHGHTQQFRAGLPEESNTQHIINKKNSSDAGGDKLNSYFMSCTCGAECYKIMLHHKQTIRPK